MDDIDRYVTENLDAWCKAQGIRAEITDAGIIAASVEYLGIGKRNADPAGIHSRNSSTRTVGHAHRGHVRP